MARDVHPVMKNAQNLDDVWSSRAVQKNVTAASAAAIDGECA